MQERSTIVLLLASGKSHDEVMQKVGASRSVVAKWKNRFLSLGMAGLKDKAGRGKTPEYDAYDEARVVELATGKPKGGYPNWRQQRIAEELKTGKSTVQRILARQRLKPHKVEYWCGKGTDPEFGAKMTAIVGLYLNPPENASVIPVDGKTQIQALGFEAEPRLHAVGEFPGEH
ncbi:MAG: hypothetical protein RLZZ165_1617, partial [Bacteroidota bacterium]